MAKRTKSSHTPSEAARPAEPTVAATALDELLPQIKAFPEDKIRRITFDIPRAVSIATATHQRLAKFRHTLLEHLPNTPIHYFDRLDKYAMAAWYAHLSTLPKPLVALDALKQECTVLKQDMLVGAEPLVHKGYFSKETVAKIKEGSGHLDLANDNVALSALYASKWEMIKDKTIIEWAQVERAAVVGPQLIVALGEKFGFGTTPSEAEQLRAKAVSLFLTAYDEVERGMKYLRYHEDDMRDIVPSIYQNNGSRSARAGDEDEDEDEALAPVAAAGAVPAAPVPPAGTTPV